jgi:PAS domain-containing protein
LLREGHALEAESLRSAFRSSPNLVFLTTPRGVVIDATSAAAAFLNVALRVLVGKPLLHFVARADVKRFRAFVNEGPHDDIAVRLRPRHGHPVATSLRVRTAPERLVWTAELAAGRHGQTVSSTSAPSTFHRTDSTPGHAVIEARMSDGSVDMGAPRQRTT